MPLSPSSLNGYDFNSQAEKKVYEAAKESAYFNNSEKYFFHSLDLAKTGDKRLVAEIDFVYLDSEAILFFEVKGGEVKFNSLSNEWWVLGGTEKGDPFKQVYGSLFHTRDKLLPELFKGRSVSNRLVFGVGVLFPECIKPAEFRSSTKDQMEFDPELIYDYYDHQKKSLIPFIEKVKKYWSNHPQFYSRAGISQKEVSTISKFFRQDLHFKLPIIDLISKGDNETKRFTGMQMFALDNLKYNPSKGAIIMGGPGTGKTVLALELLKRMTSDGKNTLLVFYNRNLCDHLNSLMKDVATIGSYEIKNIHNIYMDEHFTGMKFIEQTGNNDFWSKDLPLLFAKNLLDAKKGLYDYIIIDEGQDILNEYHFEAIDKLLKKGLTSGNWAIFLDKQFQNIYNPEADEYFNYIREVYPCNVTLLPLNCRNTISTIKRAVVQTGLPEMPCMRTDQNWKSEIKYHNTGLDFINRLNDTLTKLETDGLDRKHITILCCEKSQVSIICDLNKNKFIESAFPEKNKISVSTVHSYKGLENNFILIIGPSSYDPYNKKQMSLIYIANTRATAQSIFFLDRRYKSLIEDREDQNI